MAARTKARKRAIDVIFESDLRDASLIDTLAAWRDRSDPPVPEFCAELVTGVFEHQPAIDNALRDYLVDWTLERVSPVDRSILRSAVFELVWIDDTPDAVVIDEAVELAKSLSGDDSPAFVNGVLSRVLADKQRLRSIAVAPAASVGEIDGPAGLSVEDAPGDQALGEGDRGFVVDHSE